MLISRRQILSALVLFLAAGPLIAAAPTDPAAKKIYDHDYQWLSTFPASFISTNIRGANDQQYRERRQAALDLLRKKHDLTIVSDLMDELERRSFLSGDICDTLGEFKAKKALPMLTEVAADKKRPAAVREKAAKAILEINKPVVEEPRPVY